MVRQDDGAMGQLRFVSHPRLEPTSLQALVASCVFHAVVLSLIAGLAFFYQSPLKPTQSGSAPGAPVMNLETMVITSPPPQPTPAIPVPPIPQPPVSVSPPMPNPPMALPKLPEEGLPVLAIQRPKPAPTKPAAVRSTSQSVTSHPATPVAASQSKPAASRSLSSYAPGLNDLPHPPYPTEARTHGETGVVVMNVQFDGKGDVAQAEVAKSSGVPILDSETRSFIRAHWHSAIYAGQTISQPVEYSLENL